MKKTISFLLVCVLTCCLLFIPVHAAYSERTVSIKVLQDQSYLDMYDDQPSHINNIMAWMNYPFSNKWNITFDPGYYNVTTMPLEDCSRGYYSACTNSVCGNTCSNSYSSPNHHKNFDYNCYYAEDTYSRWGWDIGLLASSSNLCHQCTNSSHDTCGLGMVPYVGCDFAMVKLTKSRGPTLNMRVVQHEISHTFGCFDNSCTDGEDCIMSGGYDKDPTIDLTEIWCTNCAADFNRTEH